MAKTVHRQQTLPEVEVSPELLAKKIMTLLQFARKAGQMVHGFEASKKNIVNNKIKLLILTKDVSVNTKDRIKRVMKAADNAVPVWEFGTQEELSSALGLPFTGIIGILDKNFAGKLLSYFEQ